MQVETVILEVTLIFLLVKQVCGLWQLFYTLELPLIPILAGK